MPERTVLYNPKEFLLLDGIDELEQSTPTPNPFWNRRRFEVTWNLPVMAGLTEHKNIRLEAMRMADRDELAIFHEKSYIETVELFGNTGVAFSSRFGLDTDECPVFQDVHKYAAYPVGTSIDAVLDVTEEQFTSAVSFFGGLHHAMETKAAGFCYYNDCAVAIKMYRQMYPTKKCLYLDTDVHHGDGTQNAFYLDPNVMTISLHEYSMGFFPQTGRAEEIGAGPGKGYTVNVPLPPLTDDFEYWRVFEDIVVPLWKSYKPDLVFWDVGADAHIGDPLADLMLTYDTYHRLAKTVNQLVHQGNKQLVVVGGGGYNPISAAKVWTIVLSEIAGVALPPTLPEKWLDLCRSYNLTMERDGWTDRPTRSDDDHQPKIRRAIDDAMQVIREKIFPIHGLEK
ncbi:MAG: acetoin utilization protein AcuC [Candidatus Thorarchaeota archaeon]